MKLSLKTIDYIVGRKVSHKQTADSKASLIGKEIGTTK